MRILVECTTAEKQVDYTIATQTPATKETPPTKNQTPKTEEFLKETKVDYTTIKLYWITL